MRIIVHTGDESRALDVEGRESVLEALQAAHLAIDAPCGGAGNCKKCRVLIADGASVGFHLACQTTVTDGMEVTLQRPRAMTVEMGGAMTAYPADGAPGTFGLAIDVGTTTIVVRLHDLGTGAILGAVGASNPQLAFGADVISRISACPHGGLESMARLLGDTLVTMVHDLLKRTGVSADALSAAVLAGNTTMQHIAACIDPTPIGVVPFTPPTLFGAERIYKPFQEAGICEGRALFAPCLAAYVGGDITAGLLACQAHAAPKPLILMDLGTNGEMALGDARGITSCATAAGPVFEGANITYGMPAYPGAISQVSLGENGSLSLTVIGDSAPIGLCGTGLIDAIALMIEYEIVDETGRIQDPDEIDTDVSRGLEKNLFDLDGSPAFRLTGNIAVTQKDVRSLQLAKAAISAGLSTMLEEQGTSLDDIDSLLIAGGFGAYLNLAHAAQVGLFPAPLLDRARSIGNSAIDGASALLVSSAARRDITTLQGKCSYIELSTSALFNTLFVEHMTFE